MPPEEVSKLHEGEPSRFDPDLLETERSMRLIERIVLNIEERGDWENALLAAAAAQR